MLNFKKFSNISFNNIVLHNVFCRISFHFVQSISLYLFISPIYMLSKHHLYKHNEPQMLVIEHRIG